MFEVSTPGSGQTPFGKAIVFQGEMTIYARPFPEAEVVTKLGDFSPRLMPGASSLTGSFSCFNEKQHH